MTFYQIVCFSSIYLLHGWQGRHGELKPDKHGWVIFIYQSLVFSVDTQQLKTEIEMFQSLNHVDANLKPQFLIKSGCYIVPSPSTAWYKLTVVAK